MSDKILPSFEQVSELFRYDPATGNLYWKARTRGVKIGDEAGSIGAGCYWQIRIFGRLYMAHKLVWLLHHREWPDTKFDLDHINGKRLDNRIENLRLLSRQENNRNRSKFTKTGGLIGASYMKPYNKWRAYIVIDYKQTHIGVFETEQEAHDAYVAKRRELGWCELRD